MVICFGWIQSGRVQQINGSNHIQISAVSISKDGERAAFTAASPNRFAELYVTSIATFEPKQLTDFSSQWKPFKLASQEVVSWKSIDGTLIEGILIKPANYDPSRKYPLLVVIHGGPTGVDTPGAKPRPNISR